MDAGMLLARVLHIGGGVFWAGVVVFNAVFLLPAMRDAGPDGFKVASGLMKRRFIDVLPVVALITVASGFYLYWKVSAGFEPGYMGSVAGMVYGVGGVVSLLALGIGVVVMRPSMVKATALSQGPTAGDAAVRSEMQALRARAGTAGQWIAVLLVVATVAMALARYL